MTRVGNLWLLSLLVLLQANRGNSLSLNQSSVAGTNDTVVLSNNNSNSTDMNVTTTLTALNVSSATSMNDTMVLFSNSTTSSSEMQATTNTSTLLFLAGIFDTGTYDWAHDVFRHTISFLNNRTDGFHDDIFGTSSGTEFDDTETAATATTTFDYELMNDDCDETTATRAYWNVRHGNDTHQTDSSTNNTTRHMDTNGKSRVVHGIVGSRCSGASIAIARLASLEGIPQVSPVSTSPRLSNQDEFPYFSRLVAPDTSMGEVGALRAMLQAFGWQRVSILHTDSQFAKDLATEFRSTEGTDVVNADGSVQWRLQVAYANSIALNASTNQVEVDSVRQVLQEMPTDDARVNSRIVLLFAVEEHAYPILKIAHEMGFQPDTTWVGLSWIGRDSLIPTTDWLPEYPGYLGIAPYRNRDEQAQKYLSLVRAAQFEAGDKTLWSNSNDFPHDVIPYVVDSIVALARALSKVALMGGDVSNGTAVTAALTTLQWDGVSGPVRFTANGDRDHAQYTIFNYQKQTVPGGDGNKETVQWVEIGSTGTDIDSARFTVNDGSKGVCFASIGCKTTRIPSDRYPIPTGPVAPFWVWIVLPIVLLALTRLAYKNFKHKATLDDLQKKLANVDNEVDDAIERRNRLILERGALVDKPDTWTNIDNDNDSTMHGGQILHPVSPLDDEYWDVADRLHETLPTAHISSVWRVQNTALWSYYSFHKHRLALNGVDINERAVWHGTSKLDPAVIYNDTQDGFMMQYSNDGFWGRGIYFAQKSAYSDCYAFQPAKRPPSALAMDGTVRPIARDDEREMFLTKLLVGNAIEMNRDESAQKAAECRALTVPPPLVSTVTTPSNSNSNTNTNTGTLKYNTVTGHTGGSQVWIVYENGRAYPEYLVRYYKGTQRDTNRTRYATRDEAKRCSTSTKHNGASNDDSGLVDLEAGYKVSQKGSGTSGTSGTSSSSSSSTTTVVMWEYMDGANGWKAYSASHTAILEAAYQLYVVDTNHNHTIDISTANWAYRVDFVAMVQTNVEHVNRTQRSVRRRVVA